MGGGGGGAVVTGGNHMVVNGHVTANRVFQNHHPKSENDLELIALAAPDTPGNLLQFPPSFSHNIEIFR